MKATPTTDASQMSVSQLTAVPPAAASYNIDAPMSPTEAAQAAAQRVTQTAQQTAPQVAPRPQIEIARPPETAVPQAGLPGGPTPMLPPPPTAGGMTSVTPYGPDSNLIGSQIVPGQGADRVALANQYFDQFSQATAPQYAHDIDLATKAAAANGRLHSGMLTTDYGNLADRRTQALDLARQGLTTDALQASIQDAINNRNELRTERGYQSGQDQQAIANAIQQYLLSMNIGNSQLNGGEAGNPANILLGAGTSTQQQAGATGDAAANALAQYAYLHANGAA